MSNTLKQRPVSRVTISSGEAITLYSALKRDIADTERCLAGWPPVRDDGGVIDNGRQRVADHLEEKKRIEEKLARKLLLRR